MTKFLLASVALATLIAGPAVAADMRVKAPVRAPLPVADWSGWYIGVNGGGVWGTTDTGFLAVNNTPPYLSAAQIIAVQTAGSNSFNNSGGLAGGQIGYLAQVGSIIAGVEAAFDWMNATGGVTLTTVYPGLGPTNNFTINETVSTSWLATFLGRAGIDMGSWYPYVTLGVAVANLKYTNAYTDTPFGANTTATFSSVQVGPTGGGGLEWRWDGHWSLRGEYLYVRFNDVNGNSIIGNAFGSFTATHKATFTEQIGRAALSYRFGGAMP